MMKSLTSKINEAREKSAWQPSAEGSTTVDGVDVMTITIKDSGMKKYGFMSWDDTTGSAFMMTFDSIDEYAAAYCVDVEAIPNLEDVKVGDLLKADALYLRIW